MGRIQSTIGLVTGVPIADTVDKLMSIAAKPRDTLKLRTDAIRQQQLAIGELTALTIAIQMSADKLAKSPLFEQRTATSSHSDLLSAAVTGNTVAAGSYQFTPVRTATSHQMVSGGVASPDDPLGGGVLTLRTGGFVDRAVDLDLLNGGIGVERGKIRITDRSGASEVLDLRFVGTVDDVLNAINNAEQINVTAVAAGDAIQLIDRTGMTTTNLKVQEVGGGTTAADLGLAGINVAAGTATGSDLVRMHEQLKLDRLNDSTGVNIRDELPDLLVTFRDGSQSLQIDLERDDVTTVGDLLDALNAADPARLRAELSADGDRLVLTDLTAGSGTFSISSAIGGTVAEDLGLTAPAQGGTITGQRLLSGLKGALLSSLSGGRGLGTLGIVSLTDRSGATATVNLSSAETLADVVAQLNSSGLAISARINAARNGIELSDSSGATASNLIVADADATNTATKLHIAVNDAVQRIDSGSLALQVVHENTTLASLNQGRGVRRSSFFITDTNGLRGGVSLLTSGAETVGDVIDLINGLNIAVEARINDTGDGILLVDTAGGSRKITVTESGTGTTAADLNLLGESTLVNIGGTPTHVIDGSSTETLTLDADDTLQDLVAMINDRNLGIAASVLRSGSGDTPYRISLVSGETGTTGEMLVDASELNLSFREVIGAQDALLQMGSADAPGSGILITSSNNRFDSVVDGLALTIQGASDTPVSVEVKTTDKDLVAAVDLFVNQYNSLWDKIKSLTFFDEKTQTTGILFGSVETLRIESAVSRVVTSPYYGLGSIRSLEELGVSVKDDGKLAFDKTKFAAKYEADPASVERFFTDETRGFSHRMSAAIETLAGEDDSLLVSRNLALESKIQANNERLDWLNQRLDTERERLLRQFYAMELAIAKIQSNMSAIQSISAIPPLTRGSN